MNPKQIPPKAKHAHQTRLVLPTFEDAKRTQNNIKNDFLMKWNYDGMVNKTLYFSFKTEAGKADFLKTMEHQLNLRNQQTEKL